MRHDVIENKALAIRRGIDRLTGRRRAVRKAPVRPEPETKEAPEVKE